MGDLAPAQGVAGTERVLAGRYRLHAPIGAGGMGEVWRGYDESLDRRVAVKMMLAEQTSPYSVRNAAHREALETRRQRFLREVRTTAGLHEHPGIPAVYDTGIDEATGRLYVVMQLLKGREVQTLIDETEYDVEPLPVAWAAAIGAQVASALDEVHRHDVVHRDIKPANLMLTPGGVVKVLDFGVAALLGSGSHPHLTQEGMTVGTPAYMSPEQSLANAVGPAADIYALACVLYQLLTGRVPFAASDNKSLTWHHVNTPPPAIRAFRPDVPGDIERLLLGMLHKDSERRMPAAAVYEALLPLAVEGVPPGTLPMLTADGLELDPCTPFTRPFGGSVRRGPGRAMPGTPTVRDVPSAAGALSTPLTESEADEAAERAEELARQRQFSQAADVLTAALGRATADGGLAEDLNLSLAHVKFLAGAHREAAGLFEQAAEALGRRYGVDDVEAQRCRYYAAQCRMELGETTAAVAAFGAYVAHVPDKGDEDAIGTHLEALAHIMRLEAGSERFSQARAAAITLRDATRRYRGPDAPELADIDGFILRLERFQ
ncbi:MULTISPECIES: serine/threonine-protein kinase [unclassified Streptomyces]|uniref:serine/threonine-protein kinase n=1 Tax=unclassified Streptomyces TaxID=2593676 RepID=UPI003414894E